MPEDKPYIRKVYDFMQSAYGANGKLGAGAFTNDFNTFYDKITTNEKYANKIYGAINDAYGSNGRVKKGAFTSKPEDFIGKVSAPKQFPLAEQLMDFSQIGKTKPIIEDPNTKLVASAIDVPETLYKSSDGSFKPEKQPGIMADISAINPLIDESNRKTNELIDQTNKQLFDTTPQIDPMTGKKLPLNDFQLNMKDYLHSIDEIDKNLQANQAKADEFAKTTAGGLYYSFVRPVYQTAVNVGKNVLAGTARMAAGVGGGLGLEESEKILNKTADRLVDYFDFNRLAREGNPTAFANTTPTYQQGKLSRANILPKAMEAITSMATLMGGARVLGGDATALFTSSFMSTYEDYRKDAKRVGLTDNEADQFALTSAGVTSILEMISPNRFLLRPGELSSAAKGVFRAIKDGVPVREAIKGAFKQSIKEIGKENIQELSQSIGDHVIRGASDLLTGNNEFNESGPLPSFDEALETVVLTTIATGVMSGRHFARNVNPSNVERSAWAQAAERPELIEQGIERGLENGTVTQDQATKIRQDVAEYKNIYDGIKTNIAETNPNADVSRIAFDAFKSQKIKQQAQPIQGIPALAPIQQQTDAQNAQLENNIKDELIGVPEEGTEVSAQEIKDIMVNTGAENKIDQIGENDYKATNIDLSDLYKTNDEFKKYVDEGRLVESKNEEGLRMPVVISSSGNIIDGMNRLAQQYVNGAEKARAFVGMRGINVQQNVEKPLTIGENNINTTQDQASFEIAPVFAGEDITSPLAVQSEITQQQENTQSSPLNTKQNAVQVESPGTLDVRQQSTNGEGMGERNAQSEIAAGEEGKANSEEKAINEENSLISEAESQRDKAISRLKEAYFNLKNKEQAESNQDGILLPKNNETKNRAFSQALQSAIQEELAFRGIWISVAQQSNAKKIADQVYNTISNEIDLSRQEFDKAFDALYNEKTEPLKKEAEFINSLLDGSKSTLQIVDGLRNIINDPFLTKQINALRPYIENNNNDIKYSRMFTEGVGEAFTSGDWTVLAAHAKNKEALSHAIVHELYHVISLNALFNNEGFGQKITDLISTLRSQLGLNDYFKGVNGSNFGAKKNMKYYGLLNEAEFIAEIFSNKQFSDLVDNTEVGKKKPILTRVLDYLKQALGIKGVSSSDKIRQMILSSIDQKIEFDKSGSNERSIRAQKENARPEMFNYSPEASDNKWSSKQERDKAISRLKEAWSAYGKIGIINDPSQNLERDKKFYAALINYVKQEILYRVNQVKRFAQKKKSEIKRDIVKSLRGEGIGLDDVSMLNDAFEEAYAEAKNIPGVLSENNDRVSYRKYIKDRILAREAGRRKGVSEGKETGKEQGEKTGHKKGIKEGQEVASLLVGATRGAIQDVLKDTGVRLSMIQMRSLLALLNRATTSQRVDRAIDRAIRETSQMVWEAKNREIIAESKKLIKQARTLKRNKNMVIRDVEWLQQIQFPNPNQVDDIYLYLEYLKNFTETRKGNKEVSEATRQEFQDFVDQENARIYSEKKSKWQADLDELIADDILPADVTLDEYIQLLEGQSVDRLDSGKNKKQQMLIDWIKPRLSALKSGFNEFSGPISAMNEDQKGVVDQLSSINIDELTTGDLIMLNNVLNNIAEYGSVDGAGPLITSYQARQDVNKLISSDIKIRELPGQKVINKKNLSNIISALFYNDKAIAQFREKTIGGIEHKVSKVKNKAQNVVKEFVALNKKNKITPLENARLFAISYLNQYRGIENSDIANSINDKVSEMIEDIEYLYSEGQRIKGKKGIPVRKDAQQRLDALKSIGLIDYSMANGKLDIKKTIEFDEANPINEISKIANNLSPAEQEVYQFVMDQYASLSDKLEFITRTYANKEFRRERNYVSLVARQKDGNTDNAPDISEETDITRGRRSVNTRPSGTTLRRADRKPKTVYYDGDFFSNFVNQYYQSLYTAEVLPDLQRAAKVVNSEDFRKFITGQFDKEFRGIGASNYGKFKTKLAQVINDEKYSPFFKRGQSSLADAMISRGVRAVLGNVWQGPKQYAPAVIHNFSVNNPAAVTYAMRSRGKALIDKSYAKNRQLFLKNFTGIQRSAVGSEAYDKYVKRINDDMSWWMYPSQWIDKVQKLSSFVLERSDKAAQNDAYIGSYITSLMRQGVIKSPNDFDFATHAENPNKEALAYAEQMASNINNESAKAYRADVLTQGDYAKYLWLLQGFSLNAYQNAMNKAKIIGDNRATTAEKKEAAYHFLGYLGEMASYQVVGKWARNSQLAIAAAILSSVFGIKHDETEEEKKNKRDKENIRTSANVLSDITMSGLPAPAQAAMKIAINYGYQHWAKIKASQKKEEAKNEGTKFSSKGTYLSPYYVPFYGAEGPAGAADFYTAIGKKGIDLIEKGYKSYESDKDEEDSAAEKIGTNLNRYLGIPAAALGAGDLIILNTRMQQILKEAGKQEPKTASPVSRSRRRTRSRNRSMSRTR